MNAIKNKKTNMKNTIENNSLKKFEEVFGPNIINFGNEIEFNKEVIKTGSIQLDKALGIGGIPVGRIIEIYGNETSGKTTLALHVIKEAQETKKRCLFIDVENSLDIKYVKNIGINIDDLLIAHPTSGEQTFDIIEMMIKTKRIDLIIVDSVAAMVPSVEMENKLEEQQMGLHARLMSKGLRRIQSLLMNYECTIIFLNQIREKIGVFFGNPEVTTGGKALKFFSTIRIESRKHDLIKDNANKIGIQTKLTITKNKLSAPLKQAFVDIYFESGFDAKNEIINFAIQYDVIQKNGSWYAFNSKNIAQGKEQLRKVLKDDNQLFEEIKNITLNSIK